MKDGDSATLASSASERSFRWGGIRGEMLRSHLLIGLIGVVLLVVALVVILWLQKNATRLAQVEAPSVRHSTYALSGVQRSLVALEGWVVLGEQRFLDERALAWNQNVRPAMDHIEELSHSWVQSADRTLVARATDLLNELDEAQWWVEDVARSPGNEPARSMYTLDVEPVVDRIKIGITQMINVETGQVGDAERPSLLRPMADFRFALAASQAALVDFVGSGESQAEQSMLSHLDAANMHLQSIDQATETLAPRQLETLAWIEGEFDSYVTLAMAAAAVRKTDQWNRALHMLSHRANPLAREITSTLSAISQDRTALMNASADRVTWISHFVVEVALALIVIMAVLTYLVSSYAATYLTEPIQSLVVATHRLAEGTLEDDVPVTSRDEVGQLTVSFNRMRSSLSDAEQRLRDHTEELARSNDDLQKFAYVASHDLQEPLRAVAGYTQLLQQDYAEQLDDRAREYIAYAVDGAHRMRVLISDLLDYSRVQSHGDPMTKVSSRELFERAITNLHTAIEETDADVRCGDLPEIVADVSQLTRVFQNLISNGLKYRGEARPRVRVDAELEEGNWLFSVKDNGIGIEYEHLERIFQIFQRLHTRTKYPGTGIGLAICRRIIRRHGGTIWVESEPVKGSEFYFTIPQRESP